MTTTQAPGWPGVGVSPVHSLQDPSRHHLVSSVQLPTHSSTPPNPPFVFPRLAPSPPAPASAGRQRPVSAIEPVAMPLDSSSENDEQHSRRAMALPAFHFNPGASLMPNSRPSTLLSPAASPQAEYSRSMPSPSSTARHGHRRGGSEFVGGSIRDGNSIAVMSSSPTRSESGCASPGLAPPRRGHRRGVSGTISTNDVPALLPLASFNFARGSSAPNSPTTFGLQNASIPIPACDNIATLPEPLQIFEASEPSRASTSLPSSPAAALSSDMQRGSPKQARSGRARVGFSDKLEYIPRPLSLVSNETSSTATARPGHSVSGSISSIISINSPGGRDSPVPLGKKVARDQRDARPSTAGAVLDRAADAQSVNESGLLAKRRNSIPTLLMPDPPVADSNSPTATPKTPRRWTFFGRESSSTSSTTAMKERPRSSSSSECASRETSGASSSDAEVDSPGIGPECSAMRQKGTRKKSKKKKKKVKDWAGSILPLKAGKHKRNKAVPVRPPTPPASLSQLEDEEDETADNTDDTLATWAIPMVSITTPPSCANDLSSQRPRSEHDSFYPMIDLDAVLGPFDKPLPPNLEWEAAQRAGGDSAGKRRLHSALGPKGFGGGADMYHHRRTESAPDLPRFDSGRSAIHRFSSTSTMDDVFEEDEEDEESGANGRRQLVHMRNAVDDGQEASKTATAVADEGVATTASLAGEAGIRTRRRRDVERDERTKSAAAASFVRAECSGASLHENALVEERPSIIYCSASIVGVGGADSAASSPRRGLGARDLPPVETHGSSTVAMPPSPYSANYTASSHPSPQSPAATDAQGMPKNGPSTTGDNSLQSLLMMGEPGPEMRISEDHDKRSTVSSNSTMTRDCSLGRKQQRMSQPSLREQRPMSMSSTASGGWRRASLAHFSSRFISSAHGERSKLSMEMTLDESDGKRSRGKGSKTKNTFGRMMSFLKPNKDGIAS